MYCSGNGAQGHVNASNSFEAVGSAGSKVTGVSFPLEGKRPAAGSKGGSGKFLTLRGLWKAVYLLGLFRGAQ